MAGNDSSQHSDGEELILTDEQRAAMDRLTEILSDLQPDRRRAFKRYLKGMSHGEKGSKSKSKTVSGEIGQPDTVASRQSDDAGSDRAGH